MWQIFGKQRKFSFIFATIFVKLIGLSTTFSNKSIYQCLREPLLDSKIRIDVNYELSNNIYDNSSLLLQRKILSEGMRENNTEIGQNSVENIRQVNELALFAFTGCYGHDVMMREVGAEFDNFGKKSDNDISYSNLNDNSLNLADQTSHNSIVKLNNVKKSLPTKQVINHRKTTAKTAALWQINWVQILMYDFGFGPIEKPKHWRNVIMDRSNDSETEFIHEGNSLLWHTLVPFDNDQPWNLRGMIFLAKVLNRNNLLCADFLKSPQFRRFLQLSESKKIKLVVVDHLIQECFTLAASLLNAPTIQFSNWPICDRYVTPLNVPSNPSYVPITSSLFSGKSMDFLSRLRNTFVYLGFHVGRLIQSFIVEYFYATIGHVEIDMTEVESKHLFYAGRSELLFDVIRPISNRIKHFGCAYCKPPSNYYIQKPANESVKIFDENGMLIGISRLHIKSLPKTNINHFNLNESLKLKFNNDTDIMVQLHRSHLAYKIKKYCNGLEILSLSNHHNSSVIVNSDNFNRANRQEERMTYDNKSDLRKNEKEKSIMEERYRNVTKEFPHFDLNILDEKRFILVSFGSVAKVEFMPEILLQTFLYNFGNSSYNVIWQTNSNTKDVLKYDLTVPQNVHLHRWLPIRVLLAHRNIHYAILHGGINTINEVLMFGVPVLGVPLQGDQPSNLKRITELGLGELSLVKDIWHGDLSRKMVQIENDYHRYWQRAQLIASMTNMYRNDLRTKAGNLQRFWLHWAARHGERLRSSNILHLKYRKSVEHFAIVELSTLLAIIMSCMLIITSK